MQKYEKHQKFLSENFHFFLVVKFSVFLNRHVFVMGIELLSTSLEQVITNFPEAHLFLAGDCNSRIKDFLDYLPGDNLNFVFGDNLAYPADDFNMQRQNKDTQYIINFGCL